MRISISARIAILAVLLALISNVIVLAFVRHTARADAIEGVRRDTADQMDALLAVYRSSSRAGLTATLDDEAASSADAAVEALLDQHGTRVAGSGPPHMTILLTPTRFRIARLAASGVWSGSEVGYALRRVGSEWLLAARPLDQVDDQLRALERALLLALAVAILFGTAAGLILSRYVARRLALISAVMEAVGRGDLSRRVPLAAGGGDAFDNLSIRLNITLDKVEALMAELRVVTDGFAHDLRSPLGRLRARAEQAAVLPDGPAREAALGALLAETDLVMRMLSTLIEISRAEQVSGDRFEAVDPTVLVEEVADFYRPLVEDAGLIFTLEIVRRPTPVRLHRALVTQALANLIDNAFKHAASGKSVTLVLDADPAAMVITVADRGPGIAESERPTALRRFGRLDAARSTPGAGLGMALVEAVARLHGGLVQLEDAHPGLAVRMVLPRTELE